MWDLIQEIHDDDFVESIFAYVFINFNKLNLSIDISIVSRNT